MYRKEKEIIVTLISTILFLLFYSWYVHEKYITGNPNIIYDFKFWGKTILYLIIFSTIVQNIIHFIFARINKIITNEDIPSISDEMDKLIELKAIRLSYWVFKVGFTIAMVSLAAGIPLWVMFIIMVYSYFASEIFTDIIRIYFYRKGI